MRVINVGVDIDSVLADYTKSFTEVLNSYYPEAPVFGATYKGITSWDWHGWYPLPEEKINAVWNDFCQDEKRVEEFFLNIPILHYEGFDNLLDLSHEASHAVNIYFITARHVPNPRVNLVDLTRSWLLQNDFYQPQVLVTHRKGLIAEALDLDYFIDDSVANCIDVRAHNSRTKIYLPAYPYNDLRGLPEAHDFTRLPYNVALDRFVDNVWMHYAVAP